MMEVEKLVEELPPRISLKEIAKARMDEINILTNAIREPPAKGQLFQRLPKHMRRRQMSHFQNRLPRRLRDKIHQANTVEPPKRPSRKYRRKPSNLLKEYERRKKTHRWLETHIWHAKRFHMVERWSYMLADKPTNKSFRANYRATKDHCLLSDISYYCCVELCGWENKILEGLQRCVSSKCGPTFISKMFLEGCREGHVMFYHPDCYPKRVICEVSFIWKCPEENKERVLWLWVHPASLEEFHCCLNGLFNEEVKITLLTDQLNRFRLIGPLAQAILADAFQITSLSNEVGLEPPLKKIKRELDLVTDMEILKVTNPLVDFYEANADVYQAQANFYKTFGQFTSPSQLPFRMIFSLLVTDPRLTIPSQRTKVCTKECNTLPSVKLKADLASSAIWSQSLREFSAKSKLSNWEIDQIRGRFICSDGETLKFEECCGKRHASVPVMLVQQPGSNQSGVLGYGSGWDLILPSNWAMPFWQALIYRGARPGGLYDLSFHYFECFSLKNTPQIDSKSGGQEFLDISELYRVHYFSLPPNKRPNYLKLGVNEPFCARWDLLVKNWDAIEDFFVLREFEELKKLMREQKGNAEHFKGALVPVKVFCLSGKPATFASISLPTVEDVEKFKNKNSGPFEPNHVDPYVNERKLLRETHQKFLKSKKRLRKKQKKKLQKQINNQPMGSLLPEETVTKKKKKNPLPCEEACEEFNDKMENLWLPKDSPLIKTSRTLLGFLIKADFSYTSATGAGVGYVSYTGLLELFKFCSNYKTKPFALVRNNNELQYHFCKLDIIIE